jgi:precorrin-2 dehydrogenase/sirohydrochlorin ferrochelatase
MAYIINLDMKQRLALVVGGGSVALRKVSSLLEAEAVAKVVAPSICPGLRALTGSEKVSLVERCYTAADLEGAFLVVAATDSEAVNQQVSKDAFGLGLLVNVVDRPELCSFTLPAVARRGDLRIAVTTEGRCPAFAQALREELEQTYGKEYGKAVAYFGELRKSLMAAGWESERIRTFLKSLYRRGAVRFLATDDSEGLRDLLREEARGKSLPPIEPF